jgi:3-methylcrotonyl-CoA carboxylase alpha subunit
MKFTYQVDDETCTIDLTQTSDGYRAVLNGQEYPVRIIAERDGEIAFLIGDQLERAYWAADGQRRWVFFEGKTFVLTSVSPGADRTKASRHSQTTEKTLRAPMPGHVRAVQVAEGQALEKGQTLLVLEAMKMEIRVQAPQSGKLARLAVHVGDQVERDQVLGEMG